MEHQTNANTNITVSLRDEFNRNKETETSKNERIPKTDGRSMKYRNTGNGFIWTFVWRSLLLPPQGFRQEAKSRGGTQVARTYIKDSTYSSNMQSVY